MNKKHLDYEENRSWDLSLTSGFDSEFFRKLLAIGSNGIGKLLFEDLNLSVESVIIKKKSTFLPLLDEI